jgi:NTP pyrophosphatase (non-canonical NTP hydrolase)
MKEKEIKEISKKAFDIGKEKGFWDKKRNVGEMLMLTVSELGEAMEAHRKGNFCELSSEELKEMLNESYNDPESFSLNFKNTVKDTFEDEIADTIIRILDMVEGLSQTQGFESNLVDHILLKLQFNKTRPRLHGKKY